MTVDEVRQMVREQAAALGSQRAWCRHHGVTPSHLNEFLMGKRGPSHRMLVILGLEWCLMPKQWMEAGE